MRRKKKCFQCHLALFLIAIISQSVLITELCPLRAFPSSLISFLGPHQKCTSTTLRVPHMNHLEHISHLNFSWSNKMHGRWSLARSKSNCIEFSVNNLTFHLDSGYLCPRTEAALSHSPCHHGSWKMTDQTEEEEEQGAYRLRWWRCHPEACSQWGTAGSYLRQIGEMSTGSVSVLQHGRRNSKDLQVWEKEWWWSWIKRICCSPMRTKNLSSAPL